MLETPASLKELQTWFGAVITQPIDDDSRINPTAPSGGLIEEEAPRFINPSKTLSPYQRIEIYNQQYWWRLLSIMQENFPLATCLFGYYDFNKTIAVPYLELNPPNDWSLNTLGDTLPAWVLEHYHQEDKALVLDAVNVDLAYNLSFTAGELEGINVATREEGLAVLKKKVRTQPHLFLLSLSYDLIPFRSDVLKHKPDYYEENNFPKLNKKKTHIALYRTKTLNITWKEISHEEHDTLHHFQEGRSVEEFCTWLETENTPLAREAEKNLIHWFQEWTSSGWLGIVKE